MNRPRIVQAVGPLLAVAWIATAGAWTAMAQSTPPPFDRVEEDWELVIIAPDSVAEGPQITTSMSPLDSQAGQFIAFNLNYRSQPSFRSGGLEVIAYNADVAQATSTQHTAKLSTTNETITWTQSLGLVGGVMSYQIIGGKSTSWGQFGQGSGANLGVSVTSALSSMSGYHPETSVEFSGVGWQANRVASMRLLQVRYYDGNTLVAIDETVRDVNLMK
ncbi:hypothetical protein [Tautonia marina]|uniref:hypothetical protein n=1 Tax=Tautonia marina TaxID=2653855 RepID=UPI0012607457|nr:hypothetical protein [Tautonia marina]